MRLNDNQYKTLKWLVTLVLPAFISFLGVVFKALEVANAETYLTILVGFETFMGAIFKGSEFIYDKEKEGDK